MNLDDAEAVKRFIGVHETWSNAYKEGIVNAYVHYVREYGLTWEKPTYKRLQRLPNVPSTEQISKIIAHAGKKYALVFSILRDTGLRSVELSRLTLRNIDLDSGVLYPETAKGGSARALKLQSSTLAMLKEYVGRNNHGIGEALFPSTDVVSPVFMRIRDRLAHRLHEPQLKRFRLYDLRHYFATMLYHKTKDILYVKAQLGHKRIEHTLVYTQLVDFRDDEYNVRVARTVDESAKLIEAGFDFVTDMNGVKIFKKRK